MGGVVIRSVLQLLANREGQLAALALLPGDSAADTLPAESELVTLASRLPCLIRAGDQDAFSDEAGAALQAVNCLYATATDCVDATSDAALKGTPEAKYFAGEWYLQAPQNAVKDQAGSRALALKLLELVTADADTREIEEIFRRDPALSYQLLRLVNSPGIGSGRRIDSFAQAIMVLGRRQLKRWLNLLLFMPRKDDARSAMLLARVVMRARLLELLAHELGDDREMQEHAFLVGMFSLLGEMFGKPLAEVLKPLSLEAGITAALLDHAGDLGALLTAVEALERGDLATTREQLSARATGRLAVDALMIDACLWMLDLTGEGAANA